MYDWSSSTGNPTVYWFFYLLLLSILLFCGYRISKGGDIEFKKFAKVAIVSFGLIEGLRWLRGADYWHYYQDLATCFKDPVCTPEPELLYETWVNLFYFTGLHPTFGFIFYSGLLMGVYVYIFRRQPKAALWGLPVFFLVCGMTAENIIRQTLAMSFLILAYYFYVENKYKKMFLSLAAIPFIHISGLYGVTLFLLFIYKKFPFKWPLVFVGIYAFSYFIWYPEWFTGLADFLGQFDMGEAVRASYLENAERWFTQEGSISERLGTGGVVTSALFDTTEFLTNLCIIYFGFLVCKDNPKFHVAYYFAFLALTIKTMCGDIEILSRFSNWTLWMLPFVVGLIMSRSDVIKNQKIRIAIWCIFAMKFIFYGIIRAVGSIPYAGCGFIWDK